jgi:hypothetical protein
MSYDTWLEAPYTRSTALEEDFFDRLRRLVAGMTLDALYEDIQVFGTCWQVEEMVEMICRHSDRPEEGVWKLKIRDFPALGKDAAGAISDIVTNYCIEKWER